MQKPGSFLCHLWRCGALGAALCCTLPAVARPQSSPANPPSVSVKAPERFLFGIGSVVQLTAQVIDPDSPPVPDAAFVWKSSDPGIAVVDATGKVTATGFGVAAITAVAANGAEGTCLLKVLPELPGEIRASATVAYIGVNVAPMDREQVLEKQTVIVRQGRIAQVGPADSIEIPEDAERIEAEDWYLMPALADLHTHLVYGPHWENDLLLFLANGVTTVRDMWGMTPFLQWRRAIAGGAALGPRLYLASTGMDGPGGPFAALTPPVTSPFEVRWLVASYKALGYDYIKVYSYLTPDVYAAIIAEARVQGMKVVGHTPYLVGLMEVLASGQYSIEHFMGIGELASSNGSMITGVLDESRLKELAEMVRAADVWTTATLAISTVSLDQVPALQQRPEMRYVSPEMGAWFQHPSNAAPNRDLSRATANRKMVLKTLHDAGAKLILGVDSGFRYVLPGYSIHDELRLAVEAGLTPFQALRLSTVNAAVFLEKQEEMGVVGVGKRADLLLLQENPLQDVANVGKRVGLMVDGRWFSEKRLKEKLADIARSYAR